MLLSSLSPTAFLISFCCNNLDLPPASTRLHSSARSPHASASPIRESLLSTAPSLILLVQLTILVEQPIQRGTKKGSIWCAQFVVSSDPGNSTQSNATWIEDMLIGTRAEEMTTRWLGFELLSFFVYQPWSELIDILLYLEQHPPAIGHRFLPFVLAGPALLFLFWLGSPTGNSSHTPITTLCQYACCQICGKSLEIKLLYLHLPLLVSCFSTIHAM